MTASSSSMHPAAGADRAHDHSAPDRQVSDQPASDLLAPDLAANAQTAADAAARPAWQRCFLALAPDLPTRTLLSGFRTPSQARATLFDDLHLTLAFLGGLTQAQADYLAAALPALAIDLPALPFDGLERWPEGEAPRVLVATYRVPPPLAELVENVQQLVSGAGLPIDSRPFRAHITMARYARRRAAVTLDVAGIPTQISDPPMGPPPACRLPPARFTQLALYTRSDAPGGPRYRMLAHVPLKAATR